MEALLLKNGWVFNELNQYMLKLIFKFPLYMAVLML
ncbi:hypothetical protein SAMN05421786_102576 [Chryseobacterium ureilyticum]|uniref:Uncharacterized protein n=1 Tax=Chryseobacterium ureilyticum TaxID=373668 RepID=A0A1N7MH72_9FLAO|nr:hypothetical protein SAMN05421786_102576 [Chryseobacterium ureilyticum]